MTAKLSEAQILFVDDEEHLRISSTQTLELEGLKVKSFSSAQNVADQVSQSFNGIVVTDIKMPGKTGLELMDELLEIDQELPVIIITGHGDVPLAVDAMRAGAYDFVEKPFSPANLVDVVKRALEKRALVLEVRGLRSAAAQSDDLETKLVGASKIMVDLRQQIKTVAQTSADVLIVGETGTGKEVVARALASESERAGRPFVAINCAALPADLVESELFGHEAGAFAGAMRDRHGKFEHARGGIVFLDEIESMPLDIQAKLLRAIQERSITRLGSHEPIELDVRFIAASKIDLELAARENKFRKDLLYRLNVVTLKVPSLSARKSDVPRLFLHLANQAALKNKTQLSPISPALLSLLASRDWPGNVRELANVAERFVLGLGETDGPCVGDDSKALAQRMAEHEKNMIAAELTVQGGKLKQTYESLGLSRKSLYEKMEKYDLSRKDFAGEDSTD